MNFQLQKNSFLFFSFGLIITFIILNYSYRNMPNVLFIYSLLIVGVIIIKAQISIWSIKVITFFLPLISLAIQYNTGFSYGLLQSNKVPLYYNQIMLCSCIYLYGIYNIITFTNILAKEKNFLKFNLKISSTAIMVLGMIAMLSAVIRFPTLPFTYDRVNRFKTLIPGNAWAYWAVIPLYIISFANKQSLFIKRYTQFCVLFVFFEFISHYERVELMGLGVLLILLYAAKKGIKMNLKRIAVFSGVFILLLYFMTFIDQVRNGQFKGFFDKSILSDILVIHSTTDVVYSSTIAFDYYYKNGPLLGETYLFYFLRFIPGNFADKYLINNIYLQNYPYPGGSYLLNEPFLNFGLFGIILLVLFEYIVFRILFKRLTGVRYCYYIFFVAAVFRVNWYGIIRYTETAVLFYIPLLIIIVRFIDNAVISKYRKSVERV